MLCFGVGIGVGIQFLELFAVANTSAEKLKNVGFGVNWHHAILDCSPLPMRYSRLLLVQLLSLFWLH